MNLDQDSFYGQEQAGFEEFSGRLQELDSQVLWQFLENNFSTPG